MKLSLGIVGSLAVVACLASAGCSSSAQDDDGSTGATADALGQSVDVPNPSGAYFASISANGSGCPAGSWNAAISPDGQTFTVTFDQYEAILDPGTAMMIKDCTVAIDLRSPEGFSFAVSSFYYQGYAALDQAGMIAKQSAKYYFQGNPLPSNEKRSDMVGPYSDSYLFSDDVGLADVVWSPCGAQRRLNAQTRLIVQNNPAKTGTGYLNTSSVDGSLKTVFRFGLTWRQCGGGGPQPPPTHTVPPPPPPPPTGTVFPPPPPPVPTCGVLGSGQSIYKNQSVVSCDGRTAFTHQADGQVVLTHDGRTLWRNGVIDATSNVVTMQQEGHLTELSRNSRVLWVSQTAASWGAYLAVQNDCNAVVYDPRGAVLWSSNTFGCVGH